MQNKDSLYHMTLTVGVMRRFLAVIDAGLLSVTFLYGERHNVWPDHGGIFRPALRESLFYGGDRRTDESSSAVPSPGAH